MALVSSTKSLTSFHTPSAHIDRETFRAQVDKNPTLDLDHFIYELSFTSSSQNCRYMTPTETAQSEPRIEESIIKLRRLVLDRDLLDVL